MSSIMVEIVNIPAPPFKESVFIHLQQDLHMILLIKSAIKK